MCACQVVGEVEERNVTIVTKPVSIYPGGSSESTVYVHDSGFMVYLSVTPSDSCIKVLSVDPANGRTPLQVRIVIAASPRAKPGTYSVEITVLDFKRKKPLTSLKIPVNVLNSPIAGKILRDVGRLKKIYREKGIQYAVIHALSMLGKGKGLSFTSIKLLYESIVGHKVSNGTVGDLLRRLTRKGILSCVNNMYYLAVDLRTALTIIDIKRALNGLKGAKALAKHLSNKSESRIPAHVRRALDLAGELRKDNYWVAVDFIAHTLIGVRKTGLWLLWFDDYFIYLERKTGFYHYFRSSRLSQLLKELGLKPGLMINHKLHSSEKYLLKQYRSYANARRIHYVLKELGWFEYGEPLLLELRKNYLVVKGLKSGETLFESKISNNADIHKYIIYPGEHVDKENEETYFYRPSNLY